MKNKFTMNNRMKNFYMDIAEECAKMSRAVRLQVGAVIVKDNNIISFSWNGTPTGWDNVCEHDNKTKPDVIHAESNAVCKLAKSSESGNGATMFVTHAPCIDCAKLIYQSGIDTVYYKNDYRSTQGLEFLTKSNVTLVKV